MDMSDGIDEANTTSSTPTTTANKKEIGVQTCVSNVKTFRSVKTQTDGGISGTN